MAEEMRDPFGWVREKAPQIYTPTWITPNSYLIPMRDGAVLRWIFDEDPNFTYSLLVRLTENEAQRVFDADRSAGMIESVRRDLEWKGALLTMSDEAGPPHISWRYVIQPDLSEREFIDDLFSPPERVVREAMLTNAQRRHLTRTEEQSVDVAAASRFIDYALAS